jgi:ATP-dependent helicase/nuclease subunit A
MIKLQDQQQRQQATDPRRSFIVQAPAGSGKTEILTQRYLRLLSTVKAPEQIVALTFTRKAASEMRERIFLALQKAASKVKAELAHQQQTYSFAAKALKRSAEEGWELLTQPGRLRIITIDSLCQTITQAIPLLDKQIPHTRISDEPQALYQMAARACLAHALADQNLHQPLTCLLAHLDNRQDKLVDLLSDLLENREQWLSSLYSIRQQSKTNFEQMLAIIEQHELQRFQQDVPVDYRNELCFLAQQTACIEANPESPRHALSNWQTFSQLDRQIATSLAALLLTGEDTLRKSFDHHVGLKRGACDALLYENIKVRSKDLLKKLEASPNFLAALLKVKNLPPPHYDAEQWQVLQALITLLPLLVGHLHLVFNEQNEVDFNAVAQQALLALGDDEQPTDLALYLDNSIHHLLIDEFQDTSMQQYHLLGKLVQGWQPDDGRTLFVVGDPMQSIYRFRQAEVGLFLKAKQEGIGPVSLTSLALCCNFRSTQTLVHWVNSQFHSIFPLKDDIESGAISFHASVNVLDTKENSHIKAWQFPDSDQEAQALAKLLAEELQNNPNEQIAILVRSRKQLTKIMRWLREQQLPFQGVEIERLANLPHLRDLWSLTQALLLPANRLAWLSLLRGPFCGLTLADLHLIANFAKKKSIYYALSQLQSLTNLSEDGRLRAQFIFNVLQDALACRHQQPLVDWIANTLKQLHVDKILDTIQQEDLEQFWLLLERFSRTSQFPDLKHLKSEFNKLYSQRVNAARLQVMTIHKSKGLEFDCVILPSLSTKSQNKEKPLLHWLKLPSQNPGSLFLVAPLKAAHQKQCLLYDYLGKLTAEKDSYELQRLLYVAVTRAKKRLYLFASSEKENSKTFRSLLKNQEFLSQEGNLAKEIADKSLPLLSRLPSEFYLHPQPTTTLQTTKSIHLSSNISARLIGIVAHELLQWICQHHPTSVAKLPWGFVANRLKGLGLTEKEQNEVSTMLHQQITHLFNNPIGQWLSKAHLEERNEYELLINDQGTISTRIIDRTFIERGLRWIIDFKTGSNDEEAQNQHHDQVNNYAKLLACRTSEPIRCGLYYLTSGDWVEWDYRPTRDYEQ